MYKLDIISSKEPANTNYKKTELSKVKDKTGLPLKSVVNSETYNSAKYLTDKGKSKTSGNSLSAGFKTNFFADTFNGIKETWTSFFTNPIDYAKGYFVNGIQTIGQIHRNLKEGINEENYYKISRGLLA